MTVSLKAVLLGLLYLNAGMVCECQLWMLKDFPEKYVPVAQPPSESCYPGFWGQLLTASTAESNTL